MLPVPVSSSYAYDQSQDPWVILQWCNQLLTELTQARVDYEKAVGRLCENLGADFGVLNAFARQIVSIEKNIRAEFMEIQSIENTIKTLGAEISQADTCLTRNAYLLTRLENEKAELLEIQAEQAKLDREFRENPIEEANNLDVEEEDVSNKDRTLEDIQRDKESTEREIKSLSEKKDQMEMERLQLSRILEERSLGQSNLELMAKKVREEFFESCGLPKNSPYILEIIRILWG